MRIKWEKQYYYNKLHTQQSSGIGQIVISDCPYSIYTLVHILLSLLSLILVLIPLGWFIMFIMAISMPFIIVK
jgi:hypothetical protein